MPDSFEMRRDFPRTARCRPKAGPGRCGAPLVSVLLPTFNRRQYLAQALTSAVGQTYRNLEIFVINDGGEDVGDIVRSVNDPRVTFINRRANRGKPFSLNEALARAQGKYVAYLDDDDVYYPHHVEVLVDALERTTDCQAAYSDLYKTYCEIKPDGRRQVLSKHVEISRDFDRFLMLYFNHVLHVSLMHRRDLLDKTGLYNEDLTILIDWDMTRRLAFFSDFHHVHTITGEFYSPVGESDRISFQRRKDPDAYLRNILAIRTTRPPKPWPKIDDLSIMLVADRPDKRFAETMLRIWRHTFYPYALYLPMPATEASRLNIEMPNVVLVPVRALSSPGERVDMALERAQGEHVAVVPGDLPVEEMWIENPIYALLDSTEREGFMIDGPPKSSWAAVLRRTDLEHSRRAYPHLPVEASLAASGIRMRLPKEKELPFEFDEMLRQAKLAETHGNWVLAARLFEHIAERHQNELWMKTLAARAYFEAGNSTLAARLSHEVNMERSTIDTLLLEAKTSRRRRDFKTAIHLLGQAERGLGGRSPGAVYPDERLCSI